MFCFKRNSRTAAEFFCFCVGVQSKLCSVQNMFAKIWHFWDDLNLNLSFALQGYQRLWQRPKGCSNSLNRVQAALEYFGIELLCILHVKHFTMTCFFSLQRVADMHLGKTVITLSLWDLLVYSVCNWVWHLTASTCTWACMTMELLVSRQIFAVPQHSFTSNAVQLQLWHWSRWSLDPVNPVKW